MEYIKVINLFNLGGTADYKGLDLQKIVPGTQLYPVNENYCIVGYNGDIPNHADLTVVTEEEWLNLRTEIENNQPKSPIQELEEKQALMQQALDELLLGGGM